MAYLAAAFMTPDERTLLQALGIAISANIVIVAVESLAYGYIIHLTTVILATEPLKLRELSFQSQRWRLCAVSIFGLLIASAIWALDLAYLSSLIGGYLCYNQGLSLTARRNLILERGRPVRLASSWLGVIMPGLNDWVVIWRARTLFPRQKWWAVLGLFSIIADWAVGLASLCYISIAGDTNDTAITLNNASVTLTLVTNAVATFSIVNGLWVHRQFLHMYMDEGQRRQFRVHRILALLVESGLVYCGAQTIATIFSWIPRHYKRDAHPALLFAYDLGSIFIMASTVYPILVIFLVRQRDRADMKMQYASSSNESTLADEST